MGKFSAITGFATAPTCLLGNIGDNSILVFDFDSFAHLQRILN